MKDVFWIAPADGNPPVSLAIVLRPRGGDWLEDALIQLKREGIQTLASMLEEPEAEYLGLGDEDLLAERIGLRFLSCPIPDRQMPTDRTTFSGFVEDLTLRLLADESVGVHCRGSIGRATIVAACALIHLGWKPESALNAIAEARGCLVPDTDEQRAWILRYGEKR